MNKAERVFLWIIGVVLVALVIFKVAPRLREMSANTDAVTSNAGDASMTTGPEYLMYNAPYAFAPPVSNFMPNSVIGQIGQTIKDPMAPCGDCLTDAPEQGSAPIMSDSDVSRLPYEDNTGQTLPGKPVYH